MLQSNQNTEIQSKKQNPIGTLKSHKKHVKSIKIQKSHPNIGIPSKCRNTIKIPKHYQNTEIPSQDRITIKMPKYHQNTKKPAKY